MADNRRTTTRHTVSIAATLTISGAATDVTMNNLSLGGAQVASSTRYGMGQKVTIAFRVPTIEEAIEVSATVRWADGTNVGVQFDGLRPREVWGLNQYFKQLAG